MIGAPVDERAVEARVVLRRRGEQDGARHLLEVAAGDGRVGVVGGDDLALLGQLEPRVDRARRLAEDRPVGRAAAAPERAAAAVEQGQLDAALAGHRGQRRPGPGGASRRPPRSPTPCSNRSSRASPPGDRRAPRGRRGRRGRRAAPRGWRRRRRAPRSIRRAGRRRGPAGRARRPRPRPRDGRGRARRSRPTAPR